MAIAENSTDLCKEHSSVVVTAYMKTEARRSRRARLDPRSLPTKYSMLWKIIWSNGRLSPFTYSNKQKMTLELPKGQVLLFHSCPIDQNYRDKHVNAADHDVKSRGAGACKNVGNINWLYPSALSSSIIVFYFWKGSLTKKQDLCFQERPGIPVMDIFQSQLLPSPHHPCGFKFENWASSH